MLSGLVFCLTSCKCRMSIKVFFSSMQSFSSECAQLQTVMAFFLLFILVSATLLAHSTAVHATQETNDLVVITTANQLRKEIKSQLTEVLAEALPEFCGSQSSATVIQIPSEDIISTVTELLTPLLSQLSHLVTPGVTSSHPATSCMKILQLAPQSPSGLYWIRASEHEVKQMYCDMERSCKGVGGGWMRVASINMTDTSQQCPSGLRTFNRSSPPHRLCAMNIDNAGCSSAVFPIEGVEYSRVCGKIIGYQQKTPDAFSPYNRGGQTSINSHYVDGISLTHGHPHKHIWTFAAAVHEHNSNLWDVCPCTNTRNTQRVTVPPFVGHDYFCDTGSENHYQHIFYPDDPLWDGEGCGEYNTCCSWNTPPWFMKQLSSPTTDDIEMRLCSDQDRDDEDITVETIELYVQ